MFAGTNLYSQTFYYDMPGGEPGVVARHIPLIPLLQGQIAVIGIARPCIKTTTTAAMMGAGHGNHHFLYMYIKYQRTHSCMYERTYIHIYTGICDTRSQMCISVHFYICIFSYTMYTCIVCVCDMCEYTSIYQVYESQHGLGSQGLFLLHKSPVQSIVSLSLCFCIYTM